MPLGRPLKPISLTADERAKLVTWSRRPTIAQRLAWRAKIVLAAAEGHANTTIATSLRITLPTVGKWRQRFLDHRLDGLTDEPRPGTPRTITDTRVEEIVTKTLETKPKNATHWSTCGMAQASGLSQTAINRIWRAFGLKPHLHETFKFSTFSWGTPLRYPLSERYAIGPKAGVFNVGDRSDNIKRGYIDRSIVRDPIVIPQKLAETLIEHYRSFDTQMRKISTCITDSSARA